MYTYQSDLCIKQHNVIQFLSKIVALCQTSFISKILQKVMMTHLTSSRGSLFECLSQDLQFLVCRVVLCVFKLPYNTTWGVLPKDIVKLFFFFF